MRAFHSLPTVAVLVPLALACSDVSAGSPFTLTVQPEDVVQSAVDVVEINIAPDAFSEDFVDAPMQTYDTDEITTEISPAKSFVIRIKKSWVERHALPGRNTFRIDVPLQSVGNSTPDVGDPVVTVTILRAGDRIADGAARLEWPLPAGGTADVRVSCNPGFEAICADSGGGAGGGADGGP